MSDNKDTKQLCEIVSPDLNDVWNLLREIESKVDSHMVEEAIYRPKIIELIEVLEKSKGAVLVFKTLVYVGTPFVAITYWIKEHVKF